MADYQIDQTLDCSGLLCPMPIVKTSKTIKGMQIGEVLQMTSTDAGSMPDIKAWARQTGHELLSAVDEGGTYQFVVKKAR
ncbi:MAG: sulfurtransferase TusA family protein [Deltaproteobacteria bacterium]|jgi:tRNA 2-thiouridine synthesizing protein A|nr:sulfurtransferase TusA family protein [Deltaproteobacteria bacterium]MBT4266666.1 sulfurtransferase TusA family protein [Deltaproteobacteria bacterium]MBT4644715.1 sulfurtransferase TusA family protein [Deltaproteobacteria bacterium]MBT6504704.1 sulfurtransferase TusA family protein [Deltaproteobacteria bacterium]MBT6612289.1 sulfurtransferase TusA family protein [Deltaproteobacteria bacterium]